MEKRKYKICQCCVMDTSDEYIEFDENGICNRCNEYKQRILPECTEHFRSQEKIYNLGI